MDLARHNSVDPKLVSRVATFIFSLPGWWLIYYSLFVNPQASLAEHTVYRNKYYGFYAVCAIVVGLLVLLKPRGVIPESAGNRDVQLKGVNFLIPPLIQGILLVTFSYSIAGFLKDLFNLF